MSNRGVPVVLAYVGTILFAYVAFHEFSYAMDHPNAYGPAVVIGIGGIAGALVSVAVAMVARTLDNDSRRD